MLRHAGKYAGGALVGRSCRSRPGPLSDVSTGDLPMVLLVVLTAMPGATAVVTGVMLLMGVGSIGACDSIATTAAIDDDLWYATYLVLVVAGSHRSSRPPRRSAGRCARPGRSPAAGRCALREGRRDPYVG